MKDVLMRTKTGQLAIKADDFDLVVGKDASAIFDGIEPELIEFKLFEGAELNLSIYRSYRSKRKAGAIGPDPAGNLEVDSNDAGQKITPESESVNKGRK